MKEERIAQEKQERGLYYHHEEDPWDFFPGFGLEDYIEYGIIVLSDLEKFKNGTGVSSGRTVDVTIEQALEWGVINR